MREIVIIVRDLYLEPGRVAHAPVAMARDAPHSPALRHSPASPGATAGAPGIEHLARFGDRRPLPEGWRGWSARWLELPQYAAAPAASVAAAALEEVPSEIPVWLATPVHLIAGLTSLHFDRRSILRLSDAELEALAAGFRETFRGSGLELRPLAGGELLLCGPPLPGPPLTTEPARMPLTSVAEALPAGEGASALRRLGTEIEMWLHGHPLNDARARRGAPPVGTLWLWGGGAPAFSPRALTRSMPDAAFGDDAYVSGLWRLAGGEVEAMPVDWAALIGEPSARRALGVVEVAELLHAHDSWHLADALAEIDRRLVSPSLAALHRGELDRLVLLANDRSLALRAADRWRLWRRKRTALEGLT